MKTKVKAIEKVQETTINGVTVILNKFNGLSVPYYGVNVLDVESHGSRTLKTFTSKNEENVKKTVHSLVAQLSNNVGFWQLKFSPI
jgi:hypothetical protein